MEKVQALEERVVVLEKKMEEPLDRVLRDLKAKEVIHFYWTLICAHMFVFTLTLYP